MFSISHFPLNNWSVGSPAWGMGRDICQLCPVCPHQPLPCAHRRGSVHKGSCGNLPSQYKEQFRVTNCWEILQQGNLGVAEGAGAWLSLVMNSGVGSTLLQVSESRLGLQVTGWMEGGGLGRERWLLMAVRALELPLPSPLNTKGLGLENLESPLCWELGGCVGGSVVYSLDEKSKGWAELRDGISREAGRKEK